MNYTSAIFLVNDAVRAIATSYEVDADGKGRAPFTTYKSMDPTLKVGDYVVVPTDTRHRMTVVRIEEVDREVDLDSPVQLQWVVGRVDRTAFDAIVQQEVGAIEKIKSAERASRRKELADKILADNPDIQSLSSLNPGGPALPAPGSE